MIEKPGAPSPASAPSTPAAPRPAVGAAVATVLAGESLQATTRSRPAAAANAHVAMPLRPGNQVELYVDGAEAYPAMNALIDGAHERIDMEFFGFYPDEGGQRMVDRLVKKAQSGVQVNVLVDKVASLSLKNDALIAQLKAGGVRVTEFTNGYNKHPLLHAFSITDHRKVLLVDGHSAMTGGMNVGVSYEKYWHDFMVKLSGPTVQDMYARFERNWSASQGPALKPMPLDVAPHGPHVAQVAVTSPKEHEIKDGMIAAFDAATDHVFINSPYYVDKDIMAALGRAAKRGVKVTAIVPTVGDSERIDYMNKMMTNELLDAGVKVYNYDTLNPKFPKHDHVTDNFNHGKLATVDGTWTTIGTANVDTRSMNDNQEINVNVDSEAFARTIEQRIFEHDLATRCTPATHTEFSIWSWPKRFLMKQLRFLLFAF